MSNVVETCVGRIDAIQKGGDPKTLCRLDRLLADMAHATAWIAFTTAQANHDLQRYGEWRCDYGQQASMFHADYEKAGSALMNCLAEGHIPDEEAP